MEELSIERKATYTTDELYDEPFWLLSWAPIYLLNPGADEPANAEQYKALYSIFLKARFGNVIRDAGCDAGRVIHGEMVVLRDDVLELVARENLPFADHWKDKIAEIKARMVKVKTEKAKAGKTVKQDASPRQRTKAPTGQKTPNKGYAPAGTKWEDITIQFIDNQTVGVRGTGMNPARFTCAHFDMTSQKTGKEIRAWAVLRAFAQGEGFLPAPKQQAWGKFAENQGPILGKKTRDYENLRQQVRTLSKKLQEFFGVPQSPFVWRTDNLDGEGWKCCFSIFDAARCEEDFHSSM